MSRNTLSPRKARLLGDSGGALGGGVEWGWGGAATELGLHPCLPYQHNLEHLDLERSKNQL